MFDVITGTAYVVGDNVDTDQIIPAQHLSLVPTIPAERRRLGHHALSGLPRPRYPLRLVSPDGVCPYAIVIAGRNFGCGSSREHAPIALVAAGVHAVVAESYARIFFRNCLATGGPYPVECAKRLCERVRTGDSVRVDLDAGTITMAGTCMSTLRPLGEAARVIAAGGLFAYARQSGLVPERGAN